MRTANQDIKKRLHGDGDKKRLDCKRQRERGKFIVTTIMLPEEQMFAALALTDGEGTYESHITIVADTASMAQAFEVFCAREGVKFVQIELPLGEHPGQPMTAAYHRGSVSQVITEVAELTRRVRAAGFLVTRVKLEAVANNRGVPVTDEETRRFPSRNYFEFHGKIALPQDTDALTLDTLRDHCARYNAHLSRNVRKQRADGKLERFVTMRVYGRGREVATRHWQELENSLRAAGYDLGNTLHEYTLFDSHGSLDAGWLDGPEEDHP